MNTLLLVELVFYKPVWMLFSNDTQFLLGKFLKIVKFVCVCACAPGHTHVYIYT